MIEKQIKNYALSHWLIFYMKITNEIQQIPKPKNATISFSKKINKRHTRFAQINFMVKIINIKIQYEKHQKYYSGTLSFQIGI